MLLSNKTISLYKARLIEKLNVSSPVCLSDLESDLMKYSLHRCLVQLLALASQGSGCQVA
ncbi:MULTISPECIES: hypothetical protein [Pseudomonas]|uniref:hypothetical protein n=1 Tax=Pseudomonas TaxID=286 RepID=UPI000F700E07|nr:hypothetical protein C4K17_3525 [Pseudomonas chlororaphis subsp. aurantiaca]